MQLIQKKNHVCSLSTRNNRETQ